MGLLQSIFGGSSASSGNQAYDLIKGAYSPAMRYTTDAGSAVSRFLGGDTSGFDAYKDATGFDWGAEQGSRGITGNAAARGLLNSGSTQKALVRYGNDYQNQFAKDYISQYLGLGQLGLGAGNLITNAGQVSSSSSDSGGLGKAIGAALMFASDRRLKRDIVRVGTIDNGLPWYTFRYVWDAPDAPIRHGLMSDDVRNVRPEAIMVDPASGFDMVNYAMAMEA